MCCPQDLVDISRGQEIVVIKALAALQEVGEVEQQQQHHHHHRQQAAATGDGTSDQLSPMAKAGGRGAVDGFSAGGGFPNRYAGVQCGSAEKACDRYFDALLQPLEYRWLPQTTASYHAVHPYLHHPYRQEQQPLRRGERSAGRDLAFQGGPQAQAVPTAPPLDEFHRLALCS